MIAAGVRWVEGAEVWAITKRRGRSGQFHGCTVRLWMRVTQIRFSASLAKRDIVSRAFLRESSAWRVLAMFDSSELSLAFVA